MNVKQLQEEVERLNAILSDMESERQDLIEKASPIPIGAVVTNPIDNDIWTVVDIEYEFGKFRYLIEDATKTKIHMLSELNVKIVSSNDGKKITMRVNDDLVSVKVKE